MTRHQAHCNPTILAFVYVAIGLELAKAFQPTKKRALCPLPPIVRPPQPILSLSSTVDSHRLHGRFESRLFTKTGDETDVSQDLTEDVLDSGVEELSLSTEEITTTTSSSPVKAEDLPWFDLSYVQKSLSEDEDSDSVTTPLPLFTSSLIFVASIVGTVYLYFVGLNV